MSSRRFVAAAFACGLGLLLGSCSSVSDAVSDYWPHFAGGEPAGIPPRPGTPGYAAFIAHGQADATSPAPNGPAITSGSTGAVAERTTAGNPSGQSSASVAQSSAGSGHAAQAIATPSAAPDKNVQSGLY
jgi:hypothetical protein